MRLAVKLSLFFVGIIIILLIYISIKTLDITCPATVKDKQTLLVDIRYAPIIPVKSTVTLIENKQKATFTILDRQLTHTHIMLKMAQSNLDPETLYRVFLKEETLINLVLNREDLNGI